MSNGLQLQRKRNTSFDKIYAYYLEPDKVALSPNQELIKERWLAAWTLRLKKKSPTKVAEILQEQFAEQKLSRAQAFRDVQNSEKLFGNVFNADRLGRMAIHYEYALQGYKKALKLDDLKAAKGFLTEMRETYPFEGDANFNPEKLENTPIKFVVSQTIESALIKKFAAGVVDLNNLDIEDIPFQEIPTEEDE